MFVAIKSSHHITSHLSRFGDLKKEETCTRSRVVPMVGETEQKVKTMQKEAPQ